MSSPTDLPFDLGAPGPSQAASPSRVHDEVEALLAEYGLRADKDPEGDFTFGVSEQQLYVKVNEDGGGFVRVFGQWRMVEDLPGGPMEWYETATRVTMEVPLVKVMVVPDGLIVACDAVAPEGGRLDVVLRTQIENVLHGVNFWHEYLFQSAPEQPAGGRHRAPAPQPQDRPDPAS